MQSRHLHQKPLPPLEHLPVMQVGNIYAESKKRRLAKLRRTSLEELGGRLLAGGAGGGGMAGPTPGGNGGKRSEMTPGPGSRGIYNHANNHCPASMSERNVLNKCPARLLKKCTCQKLKRMKTLTVKSWQSSVRSGFRANASWRALLAAGGLGCSCRLAARRHCRLWWTGN